MESEDLRSVLTLSNDTSPEEAAHNISRSKLLDIPPDSYGDLKEQLEPKMSAVERVPAQVEPTTQDFLKTSKQHLSLAQDDIPKLSDTEKRMKYYADKLFNEPELRRKRNELARKRMENNGVLPQGDEEMLQGMHTALGEMSNEDYDLNPGSVEKWAANVGQAGIDIARSYWENRGLIGTIVAPNAALGAVGGFLGTLGSPQGAVEGLKIGAGAGLAQAAAIVPLVDSYVQTRDSLYADLTYGTDQNGKPLNLSEERRSLVARGVGVISGVAAHYAGKILAENNPFLRKFLDPKSAAKYVLSNPALMAKMDLIGGIVKSGAGEALEEGVQEIAEKVGTELGKVDGSEESFMNALDNIGLTSVEGAKRLAGEGLYAASVGFGAGAGFSAATNLPAYKSVKADYQRIQDVSRQKREVLEHQNMMLEANATMSDTKVQQLAPDEARSFKHQLFTKLGFDEGAWFTVEDLRKFADDPEKGRRIRTLVELNPELVKLSKETNSSIQMSKGDVLDIMTDFPTISEHMRLSPDGQSPLEVRNEAKAFAENLSKAETRRAELMQTLGVVENVDQNKAALNEALGELKDSPYFANETDYLERNIISEREGIVSKEEAEKFNNDLLDVKLEVARSIREDVDRDFAAKENRAFKETNEVVMKQEIKEMQDDLDLLDRFNNKRGKNLQLKENHQELGNFSPYAIDDRYLPEDLRKYYTEDPMLKKRKVFVAGGLSPDEAASLLGVESGDVLLKKLANIPDKQTIANQKKQREIELRNQIQQGFKPEKMQTRDDTFSKNTLLHLREMEYMKDKLWTTLKRGIIKIASKVPTIESLNLKAKNTINGMRIRDINPNQFKQGEARSSKLALKQFVGTEFEQAFANKEKAAYNSELMKESLNAKDKVARYQKFWKNVNTPANIQMLKDAGVHQAFTEFMTLYKLDGNVKHEGEQNSFRRWVKKQVANGEAVPVIPDRLNNLQISHKDLTVEQYQAITEFGQFMLQKAKQKNALLQSVKGRQEFMTQEMISSEMERFAKAHPDYDPTRAKREETPSKNADYIEDVKNKTKTIMSMVNNVKNIALEMDNHVVGGFFYRNLVEPFVQAQTGKRADIYELVKHTKEVINQFFGDKKNYEAMVNERLNIPEFQHIDSLNNGLLRKIDLMKLLAYMGDPDGREALQNFRDANGEAITFDTVMKVMDREINENEAAFVHNFFVEPYKKFEKASFELQKKTTGMDPEMVQGIPYTHKGKVYPGGYQPIFHQRLPDDIRAAQEVERMAEEGVLNESEFFGRMKAAEMTRQDRLKLRTGSQRPLSIDFENHFNAVEDIVHDLHFREAGIDLMKIMKQPHNVQNIKSVIGSKKFVLMLDSLKDVVSKTSEKESPLFREQASLFNRAIGYGKSLHALKAIGFNFASAAVQWDSLAYLPLRAGAKSFLYLGQTIAKLAANPLGWSEMVETAKGVLKDIQYEQDAIDDSIVKSYEEFIPHGSVFFKNYPKLGKGLTRLLQVRQKFIDSSFVLLKYADTFNKVMAVNSLSTQFLSGDIEGFSKEVVEKMSDTEKKSTMERVVKQIIDVTLTASSGLDKTAIEKNKLAKLFVNYWTDRRSRLNTIASQGNKIRKSVKTGDYNQAVTQVAALALVTGFSAAMQNVIRDDDDSVLKRLKDVHDPSDAGNFALETAFDFAKAPFSQLAQSVPGVDALLYAYEGTREYGRGRQIRPVTVPLLAVGTDIVAGANAIANLLDGGLKRLTKADRKALVVFGGYFPLGGAPSNTINKVIDKAQDMKRPAKEILKHANDKINEYIEKFKGDPEAQIFIEDLKEYQKTLPQDDEGALKLDPVTTKNTIKQVSSGGNWMKHNEETGAAGIYQFTKQRWDEIALENPSLGLTDNGRVAKDSSQQEKAMDHELVQNTKGFQSFDIPLSEENLLGAHQFGLNNFVAIYGSKGDEKLSTVIGKNAKDPVFKNFETVGSVKRYLSQQIQKAK